jgi:hypothetical protein
MRSIESSLWLGIVAYACNPTTRRRKEDCEFEVGVGNIAKPYLKKQNKTKMYIFWKISLALFFFFFLAVVGVSLF